MRIISKKAYVITIIALSIILLIVLTNETSNEYYYSDCNKVFKAFNTQELEKIELEKEHSIDSADKVVLSRLTPEFNAYIPKLQYSTRQSSLEPLRNVQLSTNKINVTIYEQDYEIRSQIKQILKKENIANIDKENVFAHLVRAYSSYVKGKDCNSYDAQESVSILVASVVPLYGNESIKVSILENIDMILLHTNIKIGIGEKNIQIITPGNKSSDSLTFVDISGPSKQIRTIVNSYHKLNKQMGKNNQK